MREETPRLDDDEWQVSIIRNSINMYIRSDTLIIQLVVANYERYRLFYKKNFVEEVTGFTLVI